MSYARRSLQVVAFLATLIVGAASMAVIVTQTTWFKQWLRGFIVRQAADYVNGSLSIGRLDGNLFFGVDLADVDVTVNGEKVVDIDDVALDYNAFTLVRGDVVLDQIRLTRPVLRLERDARGWNLARLMKARTPDRPRNRRGLQIGEIAVNDGTLYVEQGAVGTSGVNVPARIEKLDASIGITSNEDELTFDVSRISLRTAEPNVGINAMSGVIRRTPEAVTFDDVVIRTEESTLSVTGAVRNTATSTPVIDVTASSDKLAINELADLFPALRGYALQPAFDVTASGPADRMAVNLSLRDRRLGAVKADVTVDAIAPGLRAAGTARVDRFNVRALSRSPQTSPRLESDITGDARFDLMLPEGTRPVRGSYAVDVDHVRIAGYEARRVVGSGRIDGTTVGVNARGSAYGGQATAIGTVKAGAPLTLDLHGRATNVDLRNLPAVVGVPRVPSELHFAYTVTGRGAVFRGTAEFDGSMLAGASIARGTIGTFSFGDGAPTYTAKGEVAGADVERVGREFGIQALATDRYRSVINGTFDVSGSGGGRYPLTLDVTGTLVNSQLFGATFPKMDVVTRLSGGDLQVQTSGSFSGLNPAVVADDERFTGMLTGSIDAETTVRMYAAGLTVDTLRTAGQLELSPSTIGKLAIDSAVVDGSYTNREGQLKQLQMKGPDVNVTAQGAIALNDSGASNLALHAETTALDRIGEIVGQPFKGSAVVDATITGNARELKADGTLTGSNIGHGENEALSLTSTFNAVVPDLQMGQARLQADSRATFLEVAGQKINTLTADTTYSRSRLDFKAVAQEGRRELAAGGYLLIHPDHHEVHIGDLALRSEQIEWRTPAGTSTAVQYGNDRIEIQDLQLVNAEQRITATGTIGANDESLRVHADRVDVAQLDTLLLGDGRLAGRFTGDATISGSVSAPHVSSEFTLAQGAFRTFKFEALTGTVDYDQRALTMDVRLQQTPVAWITAKGTAPLTLFQPTPPGVEGRDAAGAGGVVDVEIASSQIDLGVVQGFTSYVTDVTGTLQANLHVTGSGYAPQVDGAVDIRGGAFAIPELGTSYTGLDTRLELKPDLLTVQEFKVLDSRGFPLTVGGTLAVHERSVGAVDIALRSESFEVVDNRLADLKLDTDLKITGEVRKPRVEGTLEIENGTIHLAELLERATANPYSTEATDAGIEGADEAARATPPQPASTAKEQQPGVFSALALDVRLVVPDNLVVRGNDLRPANAPVEIGDMNITVGGQVRLLKAAGADLRLVGDVDTARGNYTFQGRRFEILRDGHIRFAGTDELNPTLDIRARRVISGVETFVRVQGTLKQPELSFSSNPPLDQADILSLIVFNQPINELGEGQQLTLTERAASLAGGYLATGLSRSISNALELDEFEIETGDNGLTPALSVGEQVGEHFFFRVRQGFGDAQTTELILEYQLKDYLRVQATAAETGTQRATFRRVERAGLDLIFFFSY